MFFQFVMRLTGIQLAICAALVIVAAMTGSLLPGRVLIVGGEQGQIIDTSRHMVLPYLPQIGMPVWSPDGAWVAVQRIIENHDQILITDIAGNLLLPPYPDTASGQVLSVPAWSADSTRLAVIYGDASQADLIVLHHDGYTEAYPLEGDFTGTEPRWLGSTRLRLAVMGSGSVDLLEMRFDPFDVTMLDTWAFEGRVNRPPALAPDGEQVLLAAYTPQTSNLEIYHFRHNQPERNNLTNRNSFNDSLPEWSPDGSRIIHRMSGNSRQHLLLMEPDGANHRILWREQSIMISNLRWSSDSQQIAYVRYVPQRSTLCILTISSETVDCLLDGEGFSGVAWKP